MTVASVQSLPIELIELVLVYSATGDFPEAIAALAQTCRSLRILIYQAVDSHLWREIFLTTFDDPRKLFFVDSGFDWGNEFRRRIWTRKWLKRHAQPLRVQKVYNLRSRTSAVSLVDLSQTYSTTSSLRALEALLSVVKTCAPYDDGLYMQDHAEVDIPWGSLNYMHTLSYAYHCTPEFPVRVPVPATLNIPWLENALQRGLPPALVVKISGESRDLQWDKTPEALALGELVCCTGFVPVKKLHEEPITRLASSSSSSTAGNGGASGITGLDMSIGSQKDRARTRARELVYKLAYITRRRRWGPYLPVPSSAENISPYQPASGPSSFPLRRIFLTDSDSGSDSESDSDFVPAEDDGSSDESATSAPDAEEESQPEAPSTHKKKSIIPTPGQLMPDWTWLAAARILVEANLREMALPRLDEVITWNIWREAWLFSAGGEKSPSEADDAAEGRNGKGKKAETGAELEDKNEVPGWDWAGVEGIWRRCVSWLGYTDLLYHNVHGQFDNPGLRENTLVVPLRLRIVGYERPAVPAYPHRPTIRVEGDMGGAEWEGNPEEVGDDVRRVHGTVSMLSSGHVRWSIYSSEEDDPNKDQWVSEGIQIGTVGSEAGLLGMWTGAQHDSMDPVGPFWQWRVA